MSGGKTVFVNNLKYEARESDLVDFFSQVGKVVSATIFTFREKSKGCAIVEFETEEGCRRAFELQDKDLMGRPVNVCEDRPVEERKRPAGFAASNPTRHSTGARSAGGVREVKLTGYPSGTKWQEIKDFVESIYEKPDYAKCLTTRAEGDFAIIRFDDEDLMSGAVAAINGREYKGCTIKAVESVFKF